MLEELVQCCQSLIDVMDSKTWFAIFESLSLAETLISPKGQFRRMESILGEKEVPKKAAKNDVPFFESYITKFHSHGIDYQYQNTQYANISKSLYESTVKMNPRAFMEFIRALCRLAHESLGAASPVPLDKKEKVNDEKSYAISRLQEICSLNAKRLVGEDISPFELVSGQLINLAHLPTCPGVVRTQSCAVYGEIIISASQNEEFERSDTVEMRIVDSLLSLMAFEGQSGTDTLPMIPEQGDQSLSKLPFLNEVRKQGLEIINKLLQNSGQCIKNGWITILEIVYLVVQAGQRKKDVLSVVTSTPQEVPSEASVNTKASGLIRLAFPSIQLICTDFMSFLSPTGLSRLIQTVSAIGTVTDDVNISLTSVGLLWTLCDFILTKREQLEKEDDNASREILTSEKGSLLDLSLLSSGVTHTSMDTLWMYLLRNLSELCSDHRSEVRNSANQTLFRTISMNGQRLNLDSWDLLISHVLFPLLERIKGAPSSLENNLWDETKILTLNGISHSLIDFLHVLVNLGDRFNSDWMTFLLYIKTTCLESSQEVSMASLKCLKSLVAYAAKEEVPDNVKARIVPLWRMCFEVWLDLGKQIVEQADEKCATALISQRLFRWSDGTYPSLIHGTKSQDTLALYISLIFDIHPIIKENFNKDDYLEVVNNIQILVLYHSIPPIGATITRIRSEQVNDVEVMTACQSHYLDLLAGKLQIDFAPDVKDRVALLLSDAVMCPFIPFMSEYPDDISYNSLLCKKHTFMAFSKKSLLLLNAHYGNYKSPDLYLSGAFELSLSSLSIALGYKYECPAAGERDTVSLWRATAGCFLSLNDLFLDVISSDDCAIDHEKAAAIFNSILSSFEAFLLANSPSHSVTSEQLIDDEFFEISAIEFINSKIMKILGKGALPIGITQNAIQLLIKICGNEFLPLKRTLTFVSQSVKSNNALNTVPSPTVLKSPLTTPQKVNIADLDLIDIGPNQISPQRERIGIYCLESLFKLCSVQNQGMLKLTESSRCWLYQTWSGSHTTANFKSPFSF